MYAPEWFALQLRFAERGAAILGRSPDEMILRCTNCYLQLGLGRSFDPAARRWVAFFRGLAAAGRGRGLARKAIGALCNWALGSFGLRRLHLLTDQENTASQRLARACGFHANGTTLWRYPTAP